MGDPKEAVKIPSLFKLDLLRLSAALNGEERDFGLQDLHNFEKSMGAEHS